jgi:cell division initiation protein
MMELTPLDVRKKKGDFRRGLRGYEPGVVDDFLDLVADRMEKLVREVASNSEKVARLEQQVTEYRDREKALTEALVTAQEMREEIRAQSAREVELLRRQAEQEAETIRGDAVRAREREEHALNALRAKQLQFLASYRTFLEQELSELAAHARALGMQAGRAEVRTPTPTAAPARTPVARAEAAPARVRAPEPEPVESPEDGSGAEESDDGHVGAALAEWTTEFDELVADVPEPEAEVEAEPETELLLSDDDVVADEVELVLGDGDIAGPEPAGTPEPEPEPSYDEKAFKQEVQDAFADDDTPDDDLLDLDSFDSLRGKVDPALGESIVGPPPVIPPDQLTISPAFLERAGPGGETREGERRELSSGQDMFSSMFEDDG